MCVLSQMALGFGAPITCTQLVSAAMDVLQTPPPFVRDTPSTVASTPGWNHKHHDAPPLPWALLFSRPSADWGWSGAGSRQAKFSRACSRLYRSRFLQANIHMNSLAEIYTVQTSVPILDRKI